VHERQVVEQSATVATDVSAGKVARALILLAVAGIPVQDSDVLPGCGDLTVFDVRARGYIFGQPLSHNLSPEDSFQPKWDDQKDFQLLNLPLIFINALEGFAAKEDNRGASLVDSAYRMYRDVLAPLLVLDSMSSSGLEKITFAHLAVRIAVAKAWASTRLVPAHVPAYHVLGTELPHWLEKIEFESTDAALPVPAPSAAEQDWSVDHPTTDIRLRGHAVLYKLHSTSDSAPFLLLSAAQKSSFDVMMSLRPTSGPPIVVLIDCAFTSDSTKYVSTLPNFKYLPDKIGQLQRNMFFRDAMLVPCLVTNLVATSESRNHYASQGIVLVASHGLDCFFSPTLAPLIRSLRHGALLQPRFCFVGFYAVPFCVLT
jgi:hypothetical protein